MESIRSTDYFAAIPIAHGVGLLEPTVPAPISDQALRQHAEAEISLVALVITAAIAVAVVVTNWPR